MKKVFYESECLRLQSLIKEGFFNHDKGFGKLSNSDPHPFILADGLNNLYEPLREDAIQYFENNSVSWWDGIKPTGHTLSSQIACVNHLMLIRKNPLAVLSLINGVRDKFKRVLPLSCDTDETYISFEVVSDKDHLNEKRVTRGANCTSVDALILAVDNEDKRCLIPIEWKYTESYDDVPSKDKSSGKPGLTRMTRYNDLIKLSAQLHQLAEYKGSIYYFEPFYQLMRQTLWAEQMILHKDTERIKADYFMHIHVIPSADVDLLDKEYRLTGEGMEKSWRRMLKDQSKYVIVDPKHFIAPIKSSYPELWDYLSTRYYNI